MLGNGSYTRTEGSAPGQAHPRFFMESIHDELSSAAKGRPVFHDEPRVEVIMPGIANLTKPVFRVTDVIDNGMNAMQRWPEAYKAFLEGCEISPDGTPLEEWSILTRSAVLELKALHIRTIEDVAGLSDVAGQQVGMGWMGLRDRARAYLNEADRAALSESLTKRNDELEAEVIQLRSQVEDLGGMMRQMHAEVMASRNAPNPIAVAIPGMSDPMEALKMQEAGLMPREQPGSSLDRFATERKPKKEAA